MKFDAGTLLTWSLQVRCFLMRVDPLMALAAVLFAGGALCVGVWLPYLDAGLKQKQIEVSKMSRLNRDSGANSVAAPSENELRVKQFYENLGENGYAEQQVKTLFDIAGKVGLKLNEGTYKSGLDRNDDTETYQIELPVSGPYPAIRQFCEEVLLAIPFASLDEISFKRETISKSSLEANLKFTLYLSGVKKIAAVQP
ncbi:hypothetical protein AAKU67_000512 [Oxalobacteraceae bacterium GrIS 2.11]